MSGARAVGFYWVMRVEDPIASRMGTSQAFLSDPAVVEWTGTQWRACGWTVPFQEEEVRVVSGPITPPRGSA